MWHSSTEGLYENQDPTQADMNLRGKFTTDADGHICVPQHQAGRLSDPDRRAGRRSAARARAPQHRPAHLHFLIFKPGCKTHISQVYLPDDPTSRPMCSSA